MIRTNRRSFLGAVVGSTAAATAGCALSTTTQQTSGARGNPFAAVTDIEEDLRRIPSDQYPLPFSEQEYGSRLTRCREMMSQMGIDLLLLTWPESHCYLHGYEVTWYRTFWTPLITTAVHVDEDRLIFYDGESAVPSAATDRRRYEGGRSAKALVDDLQSEGWLKEGTVVGMEYESYLPTPAISRQLDAACQEKGAKIVDASAIMRTIRNIKSPAEITVTEHAARIADIGHRAIAETFQPGMSHLEVYAAAMHAMYVAGGEIAGIPQAVLPAEPRSIHLLPSRRQIQAGEVFAFDLCGVYKRYHVNMARTYIYGDPSPQLVRLERAARGSFDVVEREAKAGTPIATVNAALRDYFQDQGLRPSGIGYEVGIGFPPDWVGHFVFRPREETPEGSFEENIVTQWETTFREEVGDQSILATHIDTYVIEEDGARRLSAVPLDLVVMG